MSAARDAEKLACAARRAGVRVPPEVLAYTARAGALLPARIRCEVQAELLANLSQARLDAQLAGLGEAAAWQAALAQAGPVWPLALHLARVHSLPLLARLVLVGAALGGAAYAVQSSAHPAPARPAHPAFLAPSAPQSHP